MPYHTKQEVLNRISRLPNMASLPINDYAEEGGLADSFVVGLSQAPRN